MLNYLGRITNTRILIIIVICTVASIWFSVHHGIPTPQVVFHNNDKLKPLPPGFILNASCESRKSPIKLTKLSQTLFPVSNPTDTGSWVGENNKMLRGLFRCLELSKCGRNQNKVVILDSFHFRGVLGDEIDEEDIWAKSTVQALRDMGYTFLYSGHLERTIQLYHMMPDLVKLIIADGDNAFDCFLDDENCVLSRQNPDGIPAWKMFSFNFWPRSETPLGRKWTLSPEDRTLDGYPPTTYLGYSVEHSCLAQPFIEHEDREDRAYLLTKNLTFLGEDREWAWPPSFFEAAVKATGLQFVLSATNDFQGPSPPLPRGVTNLGFMTQPTFMDALARSQVFLGVGKPVTSPTPYEALCLGVPFINPIMDWDRGHPEDRTKWNAQHGILKLLDPPYVYNVFKDDLDGFVDAISNAILNPIPRYVLERMHMSAITARLRAILEKDWKSEAAELLAERIAVGESPLFAL